MLLGAFLALPLGLLARRFGDRLVLGGGLALMVLGPLLSALADGPTGIGIGRSAAGVGAVAMIVLQNKIIADWFSGRRFMWAISVSVAAYPIGVGLAQLVLPPLALRRTAGRPPSCPMRCRWRWRWRCSWPASVHRRMPRRCRAGSRCRARRECLLLVIAGLIWTAYTAGYSGYTGYVPSLMAARGEGLVLTGLVLDHRHLGQRAGDAAGRRPGRAVRRLPGLPVGHRGAGHRHGRRGAAGLAGGVRA